MEDYKEVMEFDKENNEIRDGLKRAQELLEFTPKKDYYKILGVKRYAWPREGNRVQILLQNIIPVYMWSVYMWSTSDWTREKFILLKLISILFFSPTSVITSGKLECIYSLYSNKLLPYVIFLQECQQRGNYPCVQAAGQKVASWQVQKGLGEEEGREKVHRHHLCKTGAHRPRYCTVYAPDNVDQA